MVAAHQFLDHLPTLERFQLGLSILRKPVFDPGSQPYQDGALLVRLRNALVHYKPRWRPGGPNVAESFSESKMTQALEQRGFSRNPFTGRGNPFFPDQCLGFGCAQWGLNSALRLADEFFSRVGVIPPYEQFRAVLAT